MGGGCCLLEVGIGAGGFIEDGRGGAAGRGGLGGGAAASVMLRPAMPDVGGGGDELVGEAGSLPFARSVATLRGVC
jgi:hypothetical protein